MMHLTMPHDAYRICALALDGQGGRLAAVDDVGAVRLWSELTAEPVLTTIDEDRLSGTLSDVAWIQGANALALAGDSGVHVLGDDGILRFSAPISGLQSVAVVGQTQLLVAGFDEQIRLLDWQQ